MHQVWCNTQYFLRPAVRSIQAASKTLAVAKMRLANVRAQRLPEAFNQVSQEAREQASDKQVSKRASNKQGSEAECAERLE